MPFYLQTKRKRRDYLPKVTGAKEVMPEVSRGETALAF